MKRVLAKLEPANHLVFKKMYSHTDLDAPIDTVVDNLEDGQVDWALSQVKNTYHSIFRILAR